VNHRPFALASFFSKLLRRVWSSCGTRRASASGSCVSGLDGGWLTAECRVRTT